MPLYEYKCQECGKITELLVKTPSKYIMCLHCVPVFNFAERIFSQTGRPIFKGSGFYETDYKKKEK